MFINSSTKGANVPYPCQFGDNWDAGLIGKWNVNGITSSPKTTGSCVSEDVICGSLNVPLSRSNSRKCLKFEQTTDCQNSADPVQAGRNMLFHVRPILEDGVPAHPNTYWWPYSINAGEEAGIYWAWYWIPTDAKCVFTGDLPTLLIPQTMGTPCPIMEIKDNKIYDGVTYDDAQWVTNLENKAAVEYRFSMTVPFTPSRPDAPLMHTHQPFVIGQTPVIIEPPRGEWFKLSWHIYPRVKLEVKLNEVLIETFPHTEIQYPNQIAGATYVGVRQHTGDGSAGTTRPRYWAHFVNRYCQGVGWHFIGDVGYEPLRKVTPMVPFVEV